MTQSLHHIATFWNDNVRKGEKEKRRKGVGMDLIWTWYGFGMDLVWTWYGLGMDLVWTWYERSPN